MTSGITINGRVIGPGQPPYIVAELSGNHLGKLDRAKALIDACHQAGADAVKLQTYTADTLTIDHDAPEFLITGGLWAGRTLYDLYQEAATPWDWHRELFDHAASLGMTAFSSPFDPTAVEFLEALDAPAYKVASFELVDIPLIETVGQTGKPVILSTGLATAEEISDALEALFGTGNRQAVLLHCVSGYPTPVEDSNLATMADMAARFGVPIGLSDHTPGTSVAVAATALGACLIEKHVTLARADGGPDAAFSLEPDELARLVADTRAAHAALGAAGYEVKGSEGAGRDFRRSLYVVRDVPAGALLDASNVRSIRPGRGLAPKHLPEVLGRRTSRAIRRGEPLDWSMIEKP